VPNLDLMIEQLMALGRFLLTFFDYGLITQVKKIIT
jgi:hypothetical protein